MIHSRLKYYNEMLQKGRLMPIIIGDRLAAFITFYITDNENEYDNVDPWGIFEDNKNGKFCYISQMITDTNKDNYKFSFKYFSLFKQHIKSNFPNVKNIFWRRWNKKKDIVKVYKKEI